MCFLIIEIQQLFHYLYLTLQDANRDSIIQTLLMHYGLFRRKGYLDSLAEGLQVFKIISFVKIFPGKQRDMQYRCYLADCAYRFTSS